MTSRETLSKQLDLPLTYDGASRQMRRGNSGDRFMRKQIYLVLE